MTGEPLRAGDVIENTNGDRWRIVSVDGDKATMIAEAVSPWFASYLDVGHTYPLTRHKITYAQTWSVDGGSMKRRTSVVTLDNFGEGWSMDMDT